MRPGDLTTLNHVKQWLSIPLDNTASDDQLLRLIAAASRFLQNNLSINGAGVREYEELYDGNGQRFMLLRQWPVLDVSLIAMQPGYNVVARSLGNPRTNGWYLSTKNDPASGPQTLYLWGFQFPLGRGTVNVLYEAGFKVTGEIHHVEDDSGMPPVVLPVVTEYTWVQDFGVVSGDTIFVKVESSPALNEYSVDEDGVYTFNIGNVGDTVAISYGYVPPDIEQAVIQLVGEGLRYKDRIGVKSKTLGGQETIVYDNSFLTQGVGALIRAYQKVAPF